MDALCSSSYPELLDAMRETAERERQRGQRLRALDHMRIHRASVETVATVVNDLANLTSDLGNDAQLAAWLSEAADRHDQLAKVLWALANDMRPVRHLEAAE